MAETEAVLLSRFTRMGDAEAFAEIIRRHAGLVYGAALRILADVDRASDVAQETFLQLTKDAHHVTGSLPGWLHRVATHKAIDQMRRDTSRKRREAEYAADKPRDVTDWKDLSRYVDEELNKLDNETRDILVAHFLQGQTTRQIALLHGVSQATVSRRVDAGVTRLRATLRRRGILVAAGILSTLLGKNAVQAAPPALMQELGKMALVGGHAAAGAGGASAVQPIAGGMLAGMKAKVVAAAVVAVIGAGSVVTYQQATRAPSSQSTVVTRSPTQKKVPSRVAVSTPVSSPAAAPVTTAGPSDAAKKWAELMGTGAGRAGGQGGQPQTPTPQQAAAAPPVADAATTPEGGFGGMAGAFAVAQSTPQQDQPPEDQPPAVGTTTYFYMSSSGVGIAQVENPPDEPNDSNDKSTDPK
jgi:RNA polymerase sigma factor (sigma-70 family)